uniref:Uncharacterized protein n=1 Tax=Anguilla anguilla TaxID=7936 RepID=A0A0E9U2S0_ANGAN
MAGIMVKICVQQPETVCSSIASCVILHRICLRLQIYEYWAQLRTSCCLGFRAKMATSMMNWTCRYSTISPDKGS